MHKQTVPEFFLTVLAFSLTFALIAPLTLREAQAQSSKTLSTDAIPSAPFSSGNLVIYRVGDGLTPLANTGNPVFLDEYTPSGVLVQSIAMPTTASGSNRQLVASGTAIGEGLITRSTDFRYLILTGYASNIPSPIPLSTTTATAVPRTIGRVDAFGFINTSTALTDAASASNPRSAVSTNGIDFWFTGGAGGVRYAQLGGTTSTQLSTTVTNLRQVNIFNNQLYVSTAAGSSVRIGTVGTGTPTTAGQTITNLPGFPATGEPYSFFFADLSSGVAGPDVLYVASDDARALTKYSLVSGSWVSNGTVGVNADDYRGLTGVVIGGNVTLYATRGGSQFVSLVDGTGYNGAFSGTPTVIATAAANTAFRGVAPAPLTPTASSALIRGRVTTSFGRGIPNARVTMTDTFNSTTRLVFTNSFGYFNFYNVGVGSFIIISVQHSRYTFTPDSTSFQLFDDVTDLSFTGNPIVQ